MMSFMITPTPSQIDEQVKLEREAINQGLKRLTDQINDELHDITHTITNRRAS